MGPYIWLVLLLTVVALASLYFGRQPLLKVAGAAEIQKADASPEKSKTAFPLEVLFIAILICFAGFRYYVGTDFLLYELLFDQIDTSSWVMTISESPQEIGFTIFSLVIRTFTENEAWLFFLASAITVCLSYLAMRLLSTNVMVSLLTYVLFAHYLFAFNGVRQGMAISMLYLALALWIQGKRVVAIVFAILAVSFHTSALIAIVIFLLAWWLRNVSFSVIKYLLIVLPVSWGLKLLLGVPIVIEFATMLNPRYGRYLAEGNAAGIGTYLVLLVFTVLGLLFVKFLNEDSQTRWFVLIFIAAVPFMTLATSIVEMARIANYLSFMMVFLIPMMLNGRSKLTRSLGALVLAAGYLYFFTHLLHYDGLLPYQDVWGFLPRDEMNIHIPK